MSDYILALENVSKRFGATHALRDVNLEACAGEVLPVATFAASGATASTA